MHQDPERTWGSNMLLLDLWSEINWYCSRDRLGFAHYPSLKARFPLFFLFLGGCSIRSATPFLPSSLATDLVFCFWPLPLSLSACLLQYHLMKLCILSPPGIKRPSLRRLFFWWLVFGRSLVAPLVLVVAAVYHCVPGCQRITLLPRPVFHIVHTSFSREFLW